MPFRLTDTQLHQVMQTAALLELEKRAPFLERFGAALRIRAGVRKPADLDVEIAMREALKGLLHEPAA
jgi:hypothetical protein